MRPRFRRNSLNHPQPARGTSHNPNQAMNQTNLNTELLAGESRTRKHVPVAVFAVIFIHIVLFLLLLVAAGCRARAKAAQQQGPPTPVATERTEDQGAPASAPSEGFPVTQTVVATEPALEPELTAGVTPVPEEEAGSQEASTTSAARIYVVKPGDSLWLIARKHGTTVNSLKALNQLKDDRLKTGQKLKVEESTSLRAQKT